MSILNNSLLLGAPAGAAGYSISRSLRFNSADSAYLSRTPASAGNRKTWTWAAWVKRSGAGGGSNGIFGAGGTGDTDYFGVSFDSNNKLSIGGNLTSFLITTQVFRDFSAWLHLVIALDTTQGTASNTLKVYVNGSLVTTYDTDNRASKTSSSVDLGFNRASLQGIGCLINSSGSPASYNNCYLADIHFIDGQALTPSSFTETDVTTGQLIPKAYTGTYGTNGFHLEFADNSTNTATTLGKDTSGNGNNWTPNNLSVTAGAGNDSLVDVPTNGSQTDTGVGNEVRGNYATFNPLKKGSGVTLTNGNLDISTSATSGSVHATIGVSSGKWYWEITPTSGSTVFVGIAQNQADISQYTGQNANSWGYYNNGNKYTNASSASYGATYTSNDVIGVALDADNGTLTFYKNGTSQGQAYSSLTSGPYFPSYSDGGLGSTSTSAIANFGQRPFAYTAPSGFKALCTANLPAPLVTKPNTVFDTILWTGDGASTRTISGLGFSPDFVWIKERPTNGWQHTLYDIIRGPGTASVVTSLSTDSTRSEASGNDNTHGYLSSFTSDGFGLTKGSQTSGDYVNFNTWTYVAWAWDAGSSTVTNTQGSITGGAQVRANATAGFSIVTYTGNGSNSTVGHGLGVKPDLIILKGRGTSYDWLVWHKAFDANSYIALNATSAVNTGLTTVWNSTLPTSTVFSIGTALGINTSSSNYVAYCFAPVVGYSSFGSYSGTSTSDGSFVYCGFRPKFVLIKNTDGSSPSGIYNWVMYDSVRGSYNVNETTLYSNTSDQENTTNGTYNPNNKIDFLSNGFKIRGNSWQINRDGTATYIYCAFAESPFNYSRAR